MVASNRHQIKKIQDLAKPILYRKRTVFPQA